MWAVSITTLLLDVSFYIYRYISRAKGARKAHSRCFGKQQTDYKNERTIIHYHLGVIFFSGGCQFESPPPPRSHFPHGEIICHRKFFFYTFFLRTWINQELIIKPGEKKVEVFHLQKWRSYKLKSRIKKKMFFNVLRATVVRSETRGVQ